MNAAADNGCEKFSAERELLFNEIAELKRQRNQLQTALAECRRQLRDAGIEGDG